MLRNALIERGVYHNTGEGGGGAAPPSIDSLMAEGSVVPGAMGAWEIAALPPGGSPSPTSLAAGSHEMPGLDGVPATPAPAGQPPAWQQPAHQALQQQPAGQPQPAQTQRVGYLPPDRAQALTDELHQLRDTFTPWQETLRQLTEAGWTPEDLIAHLEADTEPEPVAPYNPYTQPPQWSGMPPQPMAQPYPGQPQWPMPGSPWQPGPNGYPQQVTPPGYPPQAMPGAPQFPGAIPGQPQVPTAFLPPQMQEMAFQQYLQQSGLDPQYAQPETLAVMRASWNTQNAIQAQQFQHQQEMTHRQAQAEQSELRAAERNLRSEMSRLSQRYPQLQNEELQRQAFKSYSFDAQRGMTLSQSIEKFMGALGVTAQAMAQQHQQQKAADGRFPVVSGGGSPPPAPPPPNYHQLNDPTQQASFWANAIAAATAGVPGG